ncbi:MAG TPA: hypothetical protein VJT50_10610 [Pyrinomonadaceae bacterium]|nr:hypothetical protein [Pyrinomonadaceae bacterium]
MNKSFQIVSALCLCLVFFALASSQPEEATTWGESIAGLQMSLTSTGDRVQVAFKNTGAHDLTLNLGTTLGNSSVQLPDRIKLSLTTEQGKTRVFKFFDGQYPGVAGRVDPYVVPLRAGSTYTLELTFDQFWCTETGEYGIKLPAGASRLTARFDGLVANTTNSDMTGVKLMNFWQGTVESNTLRLQR